jgi:hypothetical protein
MSPLLQACLVNPDFTDHIITTNTTWTTTNTPNNGDFLIDNDLVIESGATLTIATGVTVHFGGQRRLIIKPNARLVLYGALTGMGCSGYTWQGVKVYGSTSAQSQYLIHGLRAQGRIDCMPGSIIENAKIGVQLFGPTYALAGGQISCTEATIKNCRIGVEFAPFQNFWPIAVPPGQKGQPRNYLGSFNTTKFLTDDAYPHGEPFFAFIYMTGVNGISMSGCTFTANIKSHNIGEQCYGIHATDAGFRVQSACNDDTYPCRNFTHTMFNKLTYAIYTANVMGNQPFNVQRATFNGCYYGIYNKGVSQGTLLFNVFNLGNVPDETFDQIGTFFTGAMSGFTFQENIFQRVAGGENNTVGSYSQGLGFFDGNVLRRNTYNGVRFGNIAGGINADYSTTTSRGLHYLCNILIAK